MVPIRTAVTPVSVEATDFAGNMTTRTAHACVQNGTGCTTDLTVRDGDNDDGATPFLDSPFWLSPDIKVNPGTSMENKDIREGDVNVIEVTVRNTGSCTLRAGATSTTYALLGIPRHPSCPFRSLLVETVDCRTETVTSEWVPGTERTTAFNWTPPAGSLPLGHACLVAWSNMAADPVEATLSVVLDNNRGQRNIAFTPAPIRAGSLSSLLDLQSRRDRAARYGDHIRSSSERANMGAARIHVPPGVTIARTFGVERAGAYRGLQPPLCPPGEDASCHRECSDSESGTEGRYAVVLSGMRLDSHVRLEGITLQETARLVLEASAAEPVPRGEFFEADVIEFLKREDQSRIALGGLTLRFEGAAQ